MTTVSRRRLLKAGAAAAILVPLLSRKSARALPFGQFPDVAQNLLLPADRRVKRVLEVFLYGGLSCWESLYYIDAYGRPDDPVVERRYTQFHAFEATSHMTPRQAAVRCGSPEGASLGVDFAKDALGQTVQIGPFARELSQRRDVLDRMRLLCMAHNLEPHEAAIPLALTGKPVGSPTMAGLGAHIQRYLTEQSRPGRRAPDSYVFSTGGVPGDNVFAAVATGMHPGRARPLRIKVDNAARLSKLLAREKLGDHRAQYDALVAAYATQYDERLRFPGQTELARAHRLAELENAMTSVANADAVKAVMEERFFEPVAGTVCEDSEDLNAPHMSFRLAAHLLTHPSEPASYVCVVDTGLREAAGGGGYDSHEDNSRDQARNLKNMFTQLLAIINGPGENDPRKLNLDDTLIILNTEFGRTPAQQIPRGGGKEGSNGRNHFPHGYVNALIGGPVRERGIVGALGPTGAAQSHVVPSETRMAALLAMGIWPFSQEAFGVSDVQGAGDEAGAVQDVTKRVLGVQS